MIGNGGPNLPDSVNKMIFSKGAPTAPLEDFLRAYEADDNIWWQILCGHHMNLFDAAIERIRELELLILNTADQVQQAHDQTQALADLAEEEINKVADAINERWPEERKDDHGSG